MKNLNFNDLPCEIKSFIYSINRDAEKKRMEWNYY